MAILPGSPPIPRAPSPRLRQPEPFLRPSSGAGGAFRPVRRTVLELSPPPVPPPRAGNGTLPHRYHPLDGAPLRGVLLPQLLPLLLLPQLHRRHDRPCDHRLRLRHPRGGAAAPALYPPVVPAAGALHRPAPPHYPRPPANAPCSFCSPSPCCWGAPLPRWPAGARMATPTPTTSTPTPALPTSDSTPPSGWRRPTPCSVSPARSC